MPTPNATLAMKLIREFANSDPVLTDLLSRTRHTAWPIGHTNCRKKTSGSGNWSDHSWGNALDIMRLTKWKDPNDPARGIAKPGQAFYLDLIWRFLVPNTAPWDLRPNQMLYRTVKHWDHIHISWNHRGTGTPPCAGGHLQTRNPSGGWVLTMDADATNPPDPGDNEVTTKQLQEALNKAGASPKLAVDGDYGPKTEATWVRSIENSGEFAVDTPSIPPTYIQFGDAVTLDGPQV